MFYVPVRGWAWLCGFEDLEQVFHEVRSVFVAVAEGFEDGGAAVRGGGSVGVAAESDEHFEDLNAAGSGGGPKGRVVVAAGLLRIGAVFQKDFCASGVAVPSGIGKRAALVGVGGVRVRAGQQKGLQKIGPSVADGVKRRGPSVVVAGVGVGAGVQKQARCLVEALFHGMGQRGRSAAPWAGVSRVRGEAGCQKRGKGRNVARVDGAVERVWGMMGRGGMVVQGGVRAGSVFV